LNNSFVWFKLLTLLIIYVSFDFFLNTCNRYYHNISYRKCELTLFKMFIYIYIYTLKIINKYNIFYNHCTVTHPLISTIMIRFIYVWGYWLVSYLYLWTYWHLISITLNLVLMIIRVDAQFIWKLDQLSYNVCHLFLLFNTINNWFLV